MDNKFLAIFGLILVISIAGCTTQTGAPGDLPGDGSQLPGASTPDTESSVPATASLPSAAEFGLPEYPGAAYLDIKSKQYTQVVRTAYSNPDYSERIYLTDDDFDTVLSWYEAQLGIEISVEDISIMGSTIKHGNEVVDSDKDVEILIKYPETRSIAGSDTKTGIHFIMNLYDYD